MWIYIKVINGGLLLNIWPNFNVSRVSSLIHGPLVPLIRVLPLKILLYDSVSIFACTFNMLNSNKYGFQILVLNFILNKINNKQWHNFFLIHVHQNCLYFVHLQTVWSRLLIAEKLWIWCFWDIWHNYRKRNDNKNI